MRATSMAACLLAFFLATAATAQDRPIDAAGGSRDSAQAGERVALVIGNASYKHAGHLDNPRHDATDMAAALAKHGFKVIVGLDLDKPSMERHIRQFARTLGRAKAGVLFYAGHGLQVSGQNYLVPIDAKLDDASGLDFEVVRLDLIQRTMERESKTNILFLDACRDNPLARNLARAMGTRSAEVGRGLAPVESGVGTLISYSTQPGNVALDGDGRNSPFAGALVERLLTSADDLSDILIAVRNAVIRTTNNRQVPWEHSALTAKFYFSPRAATAAAQPPASFAELQAEQALWSAVKDSDRPAAIRAYIEKYPNGTFVPLARVLIEDLERAGKDKPGHQLDSAQQLATALQRELKRIGCYGGPINGTWGPASRSAIADFNRHAKMTLATDTPEEASLKALQAVFARICPEAPPSARPAARSQGESGKSSGSTTCSQARGSCLRNCQAKGQQQHKCDRFCGATFADCMSTGVFVRRGGKRETDLVKQ